MMIMRLGADRRMKYALRRHKVEHDRNVCAGPPSITSGKNTYMFRLSPTAFAAERIPIESYKKLMPPRLGPSRIMEVSSNNLIIDEG